MNTREPTRSSSFRPVRAITAGVALTLFLFSVVGWHAWSTYLALARITRDEVRLQELGGVIVHLDEVLTMSARMTAATGDLGWEQRYWHYQPQLEATISEAIELAPEAAEGKGAAETKTANVELVAMEKQAFDLVRAGRRDAALALLTGDAYEAQKARYAEGIGDTLSAIRRRVRHQLELHQARIVAAAVSGITGTVVLILVWLAILSRVRWHLREQWRAQRKIRRLNDQLDARVKKRTAALQKSEAQWRSLVESVPSRIVMADRDGRISLAGRVPKGSLADEKIEGTNVREHVTPGQRDAVGEALDRVFEHGEPVTYESTVEVEGKSQWYLNRIAPVKHDGRVEAAIIVTTDVTEMKQAQQQIEEQSRLLRSVLDSMAEGVVVADTSGQFIHWNRAAETILGMGPAPLPPESWSQHYGLYLPDGVTPFPYEELPLARAARGESVDGAEGITRHAGRPDGLLWTGNARPLRDEAGNFRGGLVVFRDITAERRAEQASREHAERFRKVFEEGPLAMALVALDGRCLEANEQLCRLTKYPASEIVHRHMGELLHPVDPVKQEEITQAVLNRQIPVFNAEMRCIRKDGAVRPATLTGSVVRDQSGEPLYGLLTIQDITERRQAEEAAARHQAELARVLRLSTAGEMAAGLAHELNQPLCAISNFAKGCVRRLEGGALDGDGLRYPLERIAAESLRAGRIIHNVLDFVRKGQPKKEVVELNDVVREAAQLAEAEARQQKVALRLDLASSLPRVSIDAIQIEQVILNLVRNAIEATAEVNGIREVWLSTAMDEPDTMQVAVRDNGHGLPTGLERKLFEPFFTTKASGLGMGLSISQSIVQTHGGRVWATSNPDSGSTFRFTLPRSEPADRT